MNGFDFLLKPAAAATVSSPLSSATPFSPSCPRRSDVLARLPLLLVVLSSQGFDVRVCLSVRLSSSEFSPSRGWPLDFFSALLDFFFLLGSLRPLLVLLGPSSLAAASHRFVDDPKEGEETETEGAPTDDGEATENGDGKREGRGRPRRPIPVNGMEREREEGKRREREEREGRATSKRRRERERGRRGEGERRAGGGATASRARMEWSLWDGRTPDGRDRDCLAAGEPASG